MRSYEEATIVSLHEQKETFKSAYRDQWMDPYIQWLHRRIVEKVSEATDFIEALPQHSPSLWDDETTEDIHSKRRLIAGYHQEAELCQYDERIYGQVEQDKMFILKGAWYVRYLLSLRSQ